MLFSSGVFLFLFLPLVCFLYLIVNNSLKNYVLLMSSLFFYAWGEPRHLAIMLIICVLNYFGGRIVDFIKNGLLRKAMLFLVIALNLSVLGYFKYIDFIIVNLNSAFHWNISALGVVMPIGISFFIFQSLSYVIDVYRKEVEVQREFVKLTLYISFFPQLIAGPIVKYHDIMQYLDCREENFSNVVVGTKRFIVGLGKKVLIANTLGQVADQIFQTGSTGIDFRIAWLGAICYSLQLYYDFCGYSDMAIGLGRIFGFRFLENFNYPYISKSITEFWRRWHISLGTWFKEYLYIPLGGNRMGSMRTYINLGIVFLATGIWHGANWTFVIWGLWHGTFLIIERKLNVKQWGNQYLYLQHIYTILAFVLGWVIFRSDSIVEAISYIKVMFGLYSSNTVIYTLEYYMTGKIIFILLVAIFLSTPIFNYVFYNNRFGKNLVTNLIENIYLATILFLSVVYIAASTYNPFIYFRF